jgi:hypothetical protein
MRELRRHKRAKVALFLDWGLSNECPYQAKMTSLSLGGCFLQTNDHAKLPVDQEIFMRLLLQAELILQGTIRYSLLDIGYGVAFAEMTRGEESAIQQLIDIYGVPEEREKEKGGKVKERKREKGE